jgi:hypothetical protein
MQVGHRLACIRAIVKDKAVTGLVESKLSRNFRRLQQKMTQNLMVGRCRFGDARDGLFRNDQNVRWRLGSDVPEGNDKFILVNDLRGDFARDDFFKQGLAHSWGEFNRETGTTRKIKNHSTNSAQESPAVSCRRVRRRNSTI